MERWRRLNVYVSTIGFVVFIACLFLTKYNPLFLCLGFFGLGSAYKGFKNIYKNVDPPITESTKDSYNNNIKKNRSNKKKKKK